MPSLCKYEKNEPASASGNVDCHHAAKEPAIGQLVNSKHQATSGERTRLQLVLVLQTQVLPLPKEQAEPELQSQ